MVSAVESVRVKDGGKFQELSVQQVLDCAYKSQGCDGGSPVGTLEWLKQVDVTVWGRSIPPILTNSSFLYINRVSNAVEVINKLVLK